MLTAAGDEPRSDRQGSIGPGTKETKATKKDSYGWEGDHRYFVSFVSFVRARSRDQIAVQLQASRARSAHIRYTRPTVRRHPDPERRRGRRPARRGRATPARLRRAAQAGRRPDGGGGAGTDPPGDGARPRS